MAGSIGIAETNAIPLGMKTPLPECLKVIAPHVVEWDLQAENLNSGKIIDVLARAEARWDVLELLSEEDAGTTISWLTFLHRMRAASEKRIDDLRAYVREMTRQQLEHRDIDLPPFPDELLDYLRIARGLSHLTPDEYLDTSRQGYELAVACQLSWNAGVEDAQDDHKARNAT